jgi:hypothetical protein
MTSQLFFPKFPCLDNPIPLDPDILEDSGIILGYFGIIWDILGSIPIALRFENIQKPLRCC